MAVCSGWASAGPCYGCHDICRHTLHLVSSSLTSRAHSRPAQRISSTRRTATPPSITSVNPCTARPSYGTRVKLGLGTSGIPTAFTWCVGSAASLAGEPCYPLRLDAVCNRVGPILRTNVDPSNQGGGGMRTRRRQWRARACPVLGRWQTGRLLRLQCLTRFLVGVQGGDAPRFISTFRGRLEHGSGACRVS